MIIEKITQQFHGAKPNLIKWLNAGFFFFLPFLLIGTTNLADMNIPCKVNFDFRETFHEVAWYLCDIPSHFEAWCDDSSKCLFIFLSMTLFLANLLLQILENSRNRILTKLLCKNNSKNGHVDKSKCDG